MATITKGCSYEGYCWLEDYRRYKDGDVSLCLLEGFELNLKELFRALLRRCEHAEN